MQATAPAMAVLAEDELERSAGGFRRCGALQAFREKEPKAAEERSEGQPLAPIHRPRGKKAVELPVIDFKVDWKASQGNWVLGVHQMASFGKGTHTKVILSMLARKQA